MENRCRIRLRRDDVNDFVKTAERCDFDVNVFYNRVVVDAKSILGILSMDLSKTLTVEYAKSDSEFEHSIKKYCVA